METSIVRQAIMDEQNNVVGYEVLYKEDDGSLYNRADTSAANAIESFLNDLDSEKFFGGKTAFITFTPNLLLKEIPKMFDEKKLVIQIEDNSIIHPLAQKSVYRYKRQGYKIAVKGFEFSPRYFAIFDVVDIIKIDFSKIIEKSTVSNIIEIAGKLNKTVIAYNVNTEEAYKDAKEMGVKLKQGAYVAESQTSKVRRLDHLQSNFFQLVVEITKPEPDIDKITTIISRDVTLAYSLIKLVNSAYFALRNRVKSVKQALIVLGLDQLKQWIYLLSFRPNDGNAPTELIKISFLRASMCSELQQFIPDMTITTAEAYLLGMFSTLGIILNVPLEKSLAELSISDDVKTALISGEGKAGALLNLVRCYEKADWRGVSSHAALLGIPNSLVSQKYLECIDYVNAIWDELMLPYDTMQKDKNGK